MSEFVPGELLTDSDPVEINVGRETATVTVENTGDRPVQVGSHYHFFETNPALDVTVEVDDPSVGGTPDDSAPPITSSSSSLSNQ